MAQQVQQQQFWFNVLDDRKLYLWNYPVKREEKKKKMERSFDEAGASSDGEVKLALAKGL